jgi:hypothetical protein
MATMLASTVLVVLLASRVDAGAILRTGARVKVLDAWRSAAGATTDPTHQPA